MVALKHSQDQIKQTNATQTPAIKNSWRFGDLSASELMPRLQQHLHAQDNEANWQLVWLNNEGKQVIGLLPKVSWSVYFAKIDTGIAHSKKPTSLYKVIKTCRDSYFNKATTITNISYSDWQEELIAYSQTYDCTSNLLNKNNDLPNYQHGLMGFIGYDIAAHELSPIARINLSSQPCAALGHYDIYLTPTDFCNESSLGWSLNIQTPIVKNDNNNVSVNKAVAALIAYLDALDKKLSETEKAKTQTDFLAPLILTAQWQKSDYQQAFEQTQCYLQQGDCYQINLTQVWQGSLDSSKKYETAANTLIDYLPALHRNTQAPFAGYISVNRLDNEINSDERETSFELLSCSPELFFTFIKDRETSTHHIRTKPIKGTRPRGGNTEQDSTLKQQLIDSDKDRAENVMIVDLLRNDLGKYAKTGSVKVPHLFAIESFSNVHHMVSTITAELAVDTHPLAVLFGSLPAGSITGTPKKRAVEIISELEAGPRGAYCGTMGYMNFDGSGQWNVLIRTLQANHYSNALNKATEVSLWAGGGITIASACADEYQECLDKVGNLLAVLAQKN